jgi:hypothetical protein
MMSALRLAAALAAALAVLSTAIAPLSCSAHGECSEGQFCFKDECNDCDECHYCTDGVDGTCGSFCDGPTKESGPCTPACEDDDEHIAGLAGGHGLTISSCADVAAFCGHWKYGSTVEETCPATCGLCCTDDDDTISALASGHHGLTLSGCADVAAFCGHGMYGSIVEAVCPATCRSSSCYVPYVPEGPDGDRRLADDILV